MGGKRCDSVIGHACKKVNNDEDVSSMINNEFGSHNNDQLRTTCNSFFMWVEKCA